ncbi:FtsK/SpoIIIE domain-containing protein [Nocardia sp. NPDC059239]|uniref:FtsK/SpoIIIE domain-containing protein n=1 Tax=unclassified Nocardia TaxID=2637762 RepID=UPI0036788600
MLLSSFAQIAVPAVSALGVAAWITPGPWHGKPSPRPMSLAEVLDAAPVELRPAVLMLADGDQRTVMFTAAGLGSPETGIPTLDGWDYTLYGIEADFLMLPGQTRRDWMNEDTLDRFSQMMGAKVTASQPHQGWIRLEVRVFDTLAASATMPLAVPDDVDLTAVPVGVFEDLTPWTVPVQGRHVLVGGETGSGKTGFLGALINGMGPAIESGRVELRAIDPKGGMGLGWLEDLCVDFQCTTPEDMIAQLEGTVRDMQEAALGYRAAKQSKPVPTPDNPLVVTIIDEAATLSAFSEPELMAKFKRAHGLLLSQGRAPLFSVIETVIDPSKENVPQRQLLPYRIGLRMAEPTQVTMIHGQGAKDRGSFCDEIPHTTPGVCYVQEDGKAGFRRARVYEVTEADCEWIAQRYRPRPRPINLADFEIRDTDDFGGQDAA